MHNTSPLHHLKQLGGAYSSRVELVSYEENTFVLKTATQEEIANERAFLQQLHAAEIPALEEIMHPDVRNNQILLTYIEGSPVLGDRLTLHRAREWGKLTRAIHAQRWEAPFRWTEKNTKEFLTWREFITGVWRYGESRHQEKGMQLPAPLEAGARKVMERLMEEPLVSVSLLHGDYHSNNILCVDELLIPFDKASDIFAGDPFYDLGFVYLDFFEPYVSSGNQEEMAMYDAFVEGYGGLSPEEQKRVVAYATVLAHGRFPSPFQPGLQEVLAFLVES